MPDVTKIVFAILVCAGLAACGTTAGNESLRDETSASVDAKLSKGMTQTEVRGLFGDPISLSFTDGGKEIWRYRFDLLQPKAVNFIPYVNLVKSGQEGKRKELVILFNDEQLVEKHTMANSAIEVNTGLLD